MALPDEMSDAPAVEDPNGMSGPSLESIVLEYLTEDQPPGVTDEDVQCVADAITGSLTTERSTEVATALADGIAPSGIPVDAITEDEADSVVRRR